MCDTKMFQGIVFSEIKRALFRDCSHLPSNKYLHDIRYFIYTKLNFFSPQKFTTKNINCTIEKKAKFFKFQFRENGQTKPSDQLFRQLADMKIILYTGWHPHDQNTGPLNVTDVPERSKWYISHIAGPTLRGHSQDQNKGPLNRDFPSKEADYTVAQLFTGHSKDQNKYPLNRDFPSKEVNDT